MKILDYSRKFESPWDFMEAANQPITCDYKSARQRGEEGNKFVGGTLPDSIALATEGWGDAPNLGEQCNAIVEGIAEAEAEGTMASVSGAFLDIGAFVSGEPECFQEFTPVPAPKTMRMGVNIMISCENSKTQIAFKGAVMIAVIRSLEMSGVAVELDCVIANQPSNRASKIFENITFPLKRAGERVDENQLAYWVCHDSALRQIYFSYQDTQSKTYQNAFNTSCGRGACRGVKAAKVGCDYIFPNHLSPRTVEEAVGEYQAIMEEVKTLLGRSEES